MTKMTKQMKKKMLIVGGVFLLVVIGVIAFVTFGRSGGNTQDAPTPTARPRVSMPVNQLAINQRPYITLTPTSNREVRLTVVSTELESTSMDYELQYSSGDREEAAIGELRLNSFPTTKTILLGSQSGGGKISYHEEVSGGALVTTFYDENYKLSNEWTYILNQPTARLFTSRDEKFSVEFARAYTGRYIIIFQNPGFPTTPEGEVVSGMYSFAGISSISGLDAKVTIFAGLSSDEVRMMGWNGSSWTELSTTTNAQNEIVYSGPMFEGFVVVQ